MKPAEIWQELCNQADLYADQANQATAHFVERNGPATMMDGALRDIMLALRDQIPNAQGGFMELDHHQITHLTAVKAFFVGVRYGLYAASTAELEKMFADDGKGETPDAL